MPTCGDADAVARALTCRNSTSAAHIKLISSLVIFATSIAGISFPVILAKSFAGKPAYDRATLVIKCYAAGVILSTSLVHVLPDAFDALGDCVVATRHPWKDFPFAGLVTLIGALLALLVDLAANSSHAEVHARGGYTQLDGPHCHGGSGEGKVEMVVVVRENGDVVEERESEKVAAAEEEAREKMRQRMVSQVLEIGIIFHSVIIGVTMGMSQNVCTIKPLVAALSFHQIFEGMGLGGCIAQAGFSFKTTAYMCFMFSVTTPVGIILGMIIFSLTGYDDSSANALISEGLLGSLSSGILIYMALVDLISADFFHNKLMSSETKMKKGCYIALVLGSASMSILALWA
ncbi:zinc transporter 6, chloroplastic-like [Chenopodium quinoa]|uniref:zinc transporter 6, chloroplastic-like n=1 Tax=Chenopodium quinoa TaxID=63459 RepID=UPI000B782DDA|nr:zinc transporter 6, chloroplastic-like [Chenopodium quinoa]